MKKIIYILAALVLCFSIEGAHAAESNLSPQEQEFAKAFLPLTSHFGFTEYVYGVKNQNGMILYEYLRPEEKLESWQNMITLSLLPVGTTMDEGNRILPDFTKTFRGNLPKIHTASEHKAAFGTVYVTHYEVGDGAIKEHNISGIWQMLPGVLGNFQVQKRGGALTPEDIQKFDDFVKRLEPNKP